MTLFDKYLYQSYAEMKFSGPSSDLPSSVGKGGGNELGMGGGLPPGIKAGIAQPSLGTELWGGGGGAERWMTLGTDDSLRKTEEGKHCSIFITILKLQIHKSSFTSYHILSSKQKFKT